MDKEITYINSFQADTSAVPAVINRLIGDLECLDCPHDEIYEIVLAVDEALTNAVQETIQKHSKVSKSIDDEMRRITIQYAISHQEFDATIIDHGTGFDIMDLREATPDIESKNYHDQIENYVSNAVNKKLMVRLNGKEINLTGIGAGLKIILAFMDTLTIDLLDKKHVLSNSVSKFTDGTILTITRKRRY